MLTQELAILSTEFLIWPNWLRQKESILAMSIKLSMLANTSAFPFISCELLKTDLRMGIFNPSVDTPQASNSY
jgi:hypothetical protein